MGTTLTGVLIWVALAVALCVAGILLGRAWARLDCICHGREKELTVVDLVPSGSVPYRPRHPEETRPIRGTRR